MKPVAPHMVCVCPGIDPLFDKIVQFFVFKFRRSDNNIFVSPWFLALSLTDHPSNPIFIARRPRDKANSTDSETAKSKLASQPAR
jgi:hypothetical protein